VSAFAATALADGSDAPPTPPEELELPDQPITSASSAGYLPESSDVTPGGAFTDSIPVDVPAGRAGMAPHLGTSIDAGPDRFVVLTKDSRVLTYTARNAPRVNSGVGWDFGWVNGDKTTTTVRDVAAEQRARSVRKRDPL